jgi:hypothetical protein
MNILGTKVLYSCTEEDVKKVQAMKDQGAEVNPVQVGQLMPGMITADWSNGSPGGCCNVVVTLDGAVNPLWKTSIHEGTTAGTYMIAEF